MSNEIAHNFAPDMTLYACRYQLNGDVFITSGASDEVWGAGGNDADDYDVAMTEAGNSGHYVGDFDASGNIAAGVYRVAVYHQAGANPADADRAIAQAVGEWNGTQFELCAKKQDVLDAHVITDALITSSHQVTDGKIDDLDDAARTVLNVFGTDQDIGTDGVVPES